jgi:hypothetical protein
MRSPRLAAAILLLILAPLCAAQAPKPVRIALVIGNGAYKDAPLPNPVNDSADIAKALEASGFMVIRRDNASLKEMHLALREFGDKLSRNATGLFYFAGHGLQVRGRNFLLPVDADVAREDEVSFQSLDLNAVLEKMDTARNSVNVVILDACRNNPFGTRFQASAKGLAQVEAPPGTFIAFSTAPGSVASDGTGRNGLYTHHLVQEMQKRGASIEETFKAVRTAVRRDSQGRQIPWESTSLESAFAFREAPPVAVAAAPVAVPAAKPGSRPAAPRAAPTSIGAPPSFAKGDRWTYRVLNRVSGGSREFSLEVKDIRGDEVIYSNGATSDLLGNTIRSARGDVHRPSSHFYVFPLKAGDVRKDLTFVQEYDKRTYDAVTTIAVTGEEEIEYAGGKMRALRLERNALWKQRGSKNGGNNSWTYWYNAAVKRWVAAEVRNVTFEGKVLQHERFELVSYSLR